MAVDKAIGVVALVAVLAVGGTFLLSAVELRYAAHVQTQVGDPTNGMLPIFVLPPRDLVIGVGLMVLMGVLAGLMPALAAMRLKITDALRRT